MFYPPNLHQQSGGVRYCRTSSMPIFGCVTIYPTPHFGAWFRPMASPCTYARGGATITSLLRSLLYAIRKGADII